MSSMTGFSSNAAMAPTGAQKVGKVGGYGQYQMPQFSPEQMQLFSQMFSNVGPNSYLARLAGGDEALFEQMEAPAKRQFEGTLGSIANRFSGAGMGGRRSSGFNLATSQAASDFSQDLAARRQGLQQQAIKDLMGMSGELLGQRPYENFLMPKQPSFWKQMLLGINERGQEAAQMGAKMAMMM